MLYLVLSSRARCLICIFLLYAISLSATLDLTSSVQADSSQSHFISHRSHQLSLLSSRQRRVLQRRKRSAKSLFIGSLTLKSTQKPSTDEEKSLIPNRRIGKVLHKRPQNAFVAKIPGVKKVANLLSGRNRSTSSSAAEDDEESSDVVVKETKKVKMMLAAGCEAEPCHNDGQCFTDPTSTRGFGCKCREGFEGEFCEQASEDVATPTRKTKVHVYVSKYIPLETVDRLTLALSPVLLTIYAAIVLTLTLAIFIACCFCVELRRNSLIQRYKLYKSVGMHKDFPMTSSVRLAWTMTMRWLTCRCLRSRDSTSGDLQRTLNNNTDMNNNTADVAVDLPSKASSATSWPTLQLQKYQQYYQYLRKQQQYQQYLQRQWQHQNSANHLNDSQPQQTVKNVSEYYQEQ